MHIDNLGDGAIRIPRPPSVDAASLESAVRAWPNVVDVILTEAWLAVIFEDDAPTHVDASHIDALATLASAKKSEARTIEIPMRFEGVDLEDIARTCGLSIERVIALHLHAEYTVGFIGFQPGFAYLAGRPRELEITRLAAPRARIPKNSVGIAGPYAGIYPFEGPGGFRILGTAQGITLFDLERGALLRAGDRIRFVRA